MTDDPSSPSKKLVRETWSNLCTQDTQESHTRNTASDDSDEDALAVYLMVMALEESKKVKKRKRCTWVQPCLQNRLTLGAYHALLQELQCSDQKSLHNFLRMDVQSFAQLIQKVAPLSIRQETSMRLILL